MDIDYAKLTGEIHTDGIRYEVKMATGESLYAPLVVSGNLTTIPTKDWVTANKDSFLAVIGYQGGTYYDPFIIGFIPVKGADSSKYNLWERLFANYEKLVNQLLEAKVNTQIGPQPFMADTIGKLQEMKQENEEIKKLFKTIQ